MTAAYFAVRGVRPADFFTLPLVEQVFYYESMRREVKFENQKLEFLAKLFGAKKGG